MTQDNVALGRQGEIFVFQRLIKRGWNLPENYHENMEGLDWVFEKDGRTIKVQVKTSLKKYAMFSFKTMHFDYLIFTNLNDIWILPKEILETSNNRLTKTFKRLSNKYELLDLSGKNLLSYLLDCKITPRYWVNTAHVFFSTPSSAKVAVGMQRLKVSA